MRNRAAEPVLLFLLLLAGVCAADDFSLNGTVVNSVTSEAVPGAVVQLSGRTSGVTLADADGRFSFAALPAGQYEITAHKPGFFNEQEIARRYVGPRVSVAVGPVTAPVTVKLVPAAIVVGDVLDDNDEPVPGMSIAVERIEIRDGRKVFEQCAQARGNDDGEFHVGDLQPGEYVVSLRGSSDSGNPWVALEEQTTWPRRLYYPSARDPYSATPVRLAGGQKVELHFSVRRERAYHVSWAVSGAPKECSPGFGLALHTRRGDLPLEMSWGQREGVWVIYAIPGGQYTLNGSCNIQGSGYSGTLSLTVASDMDNLILPLRPNVSVPVTIRAESTRAHANTLRAPSVRVQIDTPATGQWFGQTQNVSPTELLINSVPPGTYEALFFPDGPWYVQSATCGGTDLLQDQLKVVPGDPCTIDVVLRDDPASVTVRFRSDKEVVGYCFRADASQRAPLRGDSMSKGSIQFNQLPPGNYYVFVTDNMREIEYRDPTVLQPYLDKATRLTVAPGARTEVTLDVFSPEPQP